MLFLIASSPDGLPFSFFGGKRGDTDLCESVDILISSSSGFATSSFLYEKVGFSSLIGDNDVLDYAFTFAVSLVSVLNLLFRVVSKSSRLLLMIS